LDEFDPVLDIAKLDEFDPVLDIAKLYEFDPVLDIAKLDGFDLVLDDLANEGTACFFLSSREIASVIRPFREMNNCDEGCDDDGFFTLTSSKGCDDDGLFMLTWVSDDGGRDWLPSKEERFSD